VLAGFYFALVTEHDWPEIMTGLAGAALGAAAAVASGTAQRGRHRPAWRWSAWLLPSPPRVCTDTGRLAILLGRRIIGRTEVRGELRELQLNQPENAARASALRAMGGWALSYAPCSYVVDIDPTTGTVLLHDVGGAGRSAVEERLTG
jgi:hypothetical protein